MLAGSNSVTIRKGNLVERKSDGEHFIFLLDFPLVKSSAVVDIAQEKQTLILHDFVIPRLLKHEGFKQAVADVVAEIPVTDLTIIPSHLPKGKTLTIGSLQEAAQNVRANMIVEMEAQLLQVGKVRGELATDETET